MRGSTPEDAEPPPAYNDLFPPGYKYLLKCEERLDTVTEASSDDNTKENAESLLSEQVEIQESERSLREDNPSFENTSVQQAQT